MADVVEIKQVASKVVTVKQGIRGATGDQGIQGVKGDTGVVDSNVTGIGGASIIDNIVNISQVDYDNIAVPDPNTMYMII